MGKVIDITGQRSGRLTAVKHIGVDKSGSIVWLWLCDCGKEKAIRVTNVKFGRTQSCGCIKETRHGLYGTRLYWAWTNMNQRCHNPKTSRYKNYGGRGISVCSEWATFEPFYLWATAHGYSDELSIDRINNDGNYEPNNCRWTTASVQANNRRKTVKPMVKIRTLAQSYAALMQRVGRG